jgi:uncharacterized SAM-binding protein YcdF (DUF218 family)
MSDKPAQPAQKKKRWTLFRKRQCTVPTWRGCLLVLLLLAVICLVVGRHLHSFLAVTQPLPGGVIVVEGWLPDYAMEQVISEFKRDHYSKVYVTGGPLEWGAPLSEYKTYAQRGAAVLEKLGLSTNVVQAVPAERVRQDRTYAAAAALRAWCDAHQVKLDKVLLVSEGPHARRSWLLCEKALGPGVQVGVIAIPVEDYDAKHWWRYSAGVRGVIGEFLAYLYAKILFHPQS